MPLSGRMRVATALRVHCPLLDATMTAMLGGDLKAIENDPIGSAILAVIRADNPAGDFSLYDAVVEVVPALESFRPAPGSRAAQGEVGKVEHSPTAIITTYIPKDATPAQIGALLDRIIDIHPWQVPVIELSEVRLLVP